MEQSAAVVVIARFTARAGSEDAVESALVRAVEDTAAQDAGCELYALHRDSRTGDFVIVEKWSSDGDLGAHGKGAAYSQLTSDLESLLQEPMQVTLLRPMEAGDAVVCRI